MSALGWIIGGVVVGGVYLLVREEVETPLWSKKTTPNPVPKPTPSTEQCPFPLDKKKLNTWLEAHNWFGFFSPTCPPPSGYTALAKAVPEVNNVPPGVSLIGICDDTGDFYFYAGPGSKPVKRDDLRADYCKNVSKLSGARRTVPATWLPAR